MPSETHPAERERLRAATLRAIESLVSRDATAEQLSGWSEVIERFANEVEGRPPESVLWGIGSRGMFAVKGLLVPPAFAAPPGQAGDTVRASLTFGRDQEGHPGLAHGGSIAQAFDYLVSMFDVGGDVRIFTSQLNVRFLKPIPIGAEVTFEAEFESAEDRHRTVSARALVDETIHAEADAILVLGRSKP